MSHDVMIIRAADISIKKKKFAVVTANEMVPVLAKVKDTPHE